MRKHYCVHAARPYGELEFMSEDQSLLLFRKENAVEDFRTLIELLILLKLLKELSVKHTQLQLRKRSSWFRQ
jgi:hypothetical protein